MRNETNNAKGRKTMNTAMDIILYLGRNAASNTEYVGMMRHTGTETVGEMIRHLAMRAKTGREDIVLSLWSLRYTT